MVDNKKDNVCCPYLAVVNCSDTDEHKHLICTFSVTVIVNETVATLCIGNFKECINFLGGDK